ncbi:MAG: metallophosphoesterase family protein [Kiritimatiellia bacterium]
MKRVFLLVCLLSSVCIAPAFATETNDFWFVQISDTHHGNPLHQWRFREAIKAIQNLPVPISCVIHTGDFSSNNFFREEVAGSISNLCALLPQPVLTVLGNHDVPIYKNNNTKRYFEGAEVFKKYFGDLAQVHESEEALFVAVCTESIRQKNAPPFPDFDPIAALEVALEKAPQKPAFVFTHVPDCDDFVNNEIVPGWENGEGLEAWRKALARHQNVRAVIAGHFHRNVYANHPDGIPTIVVSSIATFWGRQGVFRLFHYKNGVLSSQDIYIEDPPKDAHINYDGFVVPAPSASGQPAPLTGAGKPE